MKIFSINLGAASLACGLLWLGACSPAPTPVEPVATTSSSAPATQPLTAGPDSVSSGDTTITVLERPSADPMIPPPPRTGLAATTDQGCHAASACRERGQCSPDGNRCAAVSLADCRWVPACSNGSCALDSGSCVPQSDCAKSGGCLAAGRCANVAGVCAATTTAHCAASALCTDEGLCDVKEGRCVASQEAHCRASQACKNRGQCGLDGDRCVAVSTTDCRRSAACLNGGACTAIEGECMRNCTVSEACKRDGRCGTQKTPDVSWTCRATNEAECERSARCAERGQCSVLGGRCVAADNVDCGRSQLCAEEGRCTAARNRCVAAGDAECKRSTVACAVEGRCKATNGTCSR